MGLRQRCSILHCPESSAAAGEFSTAISPYDSYYSVPEPPRCCLPPGAGPASSDVSTRRRYPCRVYLPDQEGKSPSYLRLLCWRSPIDVSCRSCSCTAV